MDDDRRAEGVRGDFMIVQAICQQAELAYARFWPIAVTPGPFMRQSVPCRLLTHPYNWGELGGVMSDTWTIAEAAMIIEKPTQLFQKTVERAPVKPALTQHGRRRMYVFEMRDLVFFCALDDMKEGITSNKQIELYNSLKSIPEQATIGSISIGALSYDFKPYARRVKKKIEEAETLFKLIDRTGGEPAIKGTDINAYRIAALRDGMSVEEILRDYPSLSEQQVVAAKAYAESHPKSGRPYPKITAKRAMREARADAGQFLPTRG
jgi:uncharacterized protein (DUF433 family)